MACIYLVIYLYSIYIISGSNTVPFLRYNTSNVGMTFRISNLFPTPPYVSETAVTLEP